MKKYLISLLAITAIVFASCSSLPEPGNTDEVLVVGNFILDFPDGFFDLTSRTVRSNVKLRIKNRITGEITNVSTRNGYFHVVGYKGDDFEILEYDYRYKGSNAEYTMGNKVNKKFTANSDKVNYIGDIKIIYTAGEISSHRGSLEKYYSYKRSFTNQDNSQKALEYYKFNNPDSSWFDKGIELIELK